MLTILFIQYSLYSIPGWIWNIVRLDSGLLNMWKQTGNGSDICQSVCRLGRQILWESYVTENADCCCRRPDFKKRDSLLPPHPTLKTWVVSSCSALRRISDEHPRAVSHDLTLLNFSWGITISRFHLDHTVPGQCYAQIHPWDNLNSEQFHKNNLFHYDFLLIYYPAVAVTPGGAAPGRQLDATRVHCVRCWFISFSWLAAESHVGMRVCFKCEQSFSRCKCKISDMGHI